MIDMILSIILPPHEVKKLVWPYVFPTNNLFVEPRSAPLDLTQSQFPPSTEVDCPPTGVDAAPVKDGIRSGPFL